MLRLDDRHDTAPPRDHGHPPLAPAVPARTGGGDDDGAARRELRRQIARLERDLADALVAAFPRVTVDVAVAAPRGRRGPRLLGVGELEALRDGLALRLRDARRVVEEKGREEEAKRELLERMLQDPGAHRFTRVSLRELGEDGCGVWHVRPRLGLIGMLAGWWHVKLSSGCPLGPTRPVVSRPMGKRSRKRSSTGTMPRPATTPAPSGGGKRAPGTPVTHRAKLDEAPPALWAPLPLTEISVLVGLVLAVVGFTTGGAVPLIAGIVLVSLAAVELSVREHFAGYRSHTALLSALAAVLVAAGLTTTSLAQGVVVAVAAAVFAGAFPLLRTAFARRAGGLTFRV